MEEQKHEIKIDLGELTNEEIIMILEHRKTEKQKTFWQKEPIYLWKDVRRALSRRIIDYTLLYVIVKYGLSDFLKV